MTQFLKKGVNKAEGKFIYPEPTQTGTGNCGAYAAASCLYAFALDHEKGLLPDVNGGTENEQFQVQIQRLVERLTALIYTNKKNSMADGVKEYIKEKKLSDKFKVTEFSGKGEYQLPDGKKQSHWDFAISELKRCQDVIPYIRWKKADGSFAKHAITLVGIDPDKKEVIAANPWGTPRGTTNVRPEEAGNNFQQGKQNRAYTKYKYKIKDGKVILEFEGFEAEIYNFLKICPEKAPAKVKEKAPKRIPLPKGKEVMRYFYSVENESFQAINVFALPLPKAKASDIEQIHAPEGWSTALWYANEEPNFSLPAPELSAKNDFLGVIWRSASQQIVAADESCKHFAVDLKIPSIDYSDPLAKKAEKLLGKIEPWIQTEETGILVSENFEGSHALYVDISAPTKNKNGFLLEYLLDCFKEQDDFYFPQPEEDNEPADEDTKPDEAQ